MIDPYKKITTDTECLKKEMFMYSSYCWGQQDLRVQLPDVINHLYIFFNGKVPYYFNIP